MTSSHPDGGPPIGQEGSRDWQEELAASRREVADLHRELEETNLGLIALHAELEDARQAEARLAAIVQFSGDAMFSMTPDGAIQTWNPGAERLFGFSEVEIVGLPAGILVPDELKDEFSAAMLRLQAGNRAVGFDTRRLRKDGTVVDVAVTLSAMRDAGGTLVGLSAVLRDVTGRLRAEAELAAARVTREVLAERDRMARDLHDRVIQRIFGAALTLQGAVSLAGHPDMAARIEAVIRELDMSIDEIRAAIFTLQRGPQDPASLRAEILDLVSDAAQGLGFTPTVSFSGPVDTVVPENVATQVLAVAREALSNMTRHARASAGEVKLSADSELVLEVTDNGQGIGA
ncbi:MAG TPA: PAS domain S-box protein, partial [Actinobacteria bacterium]|nr:PAS domain S-box protein [Actinomycetota bacterium]